MKKASLLIAVLLLPLFYLAHQYNTADEHQVKETNHEPAAKQPSSVTQAAIHADAPLPNLGNELMMSLSSSELKALRPAIEHFWQQCQAQKNCQQQLSFLAKKLNPERFLLLKEYPQRLQHYQQSLGNSLSLHARSMGEKIAHLQELQTTAFGAQAVHIFAAEYEYYAQQQWIDEAATSVKHLALTEQLSAFDALLQEQLPSSSKEQRYHFAKALTTTETDLKQHFQQQEQLINYYFDADQAEPYLQQLQQQYQQQLNTEQYQLGLAKLKTRLEQQRKEEKADVDDADWQSYQQQALRDFRINFFQATE